MTRPALVPSKPRASALDPSVLAVHRSRGLVLLALSLVVPCLLSLAPRAFAVEPERTLEQAIPLEDADFLKVSTQVGRIEVNGRGGWSDEVRVDIEVYCDSDNASACRHAAEEVELEWRRGEAGLELQTRGSTQLRAHHIRIITRISVPEETSMEVRIGVGELVLEDVEGDIEARVQTGDIRMSLRTKYFSRAEVSSNFGEAALYVDDGRIEGSGFLRKGIEWRDGKGSSSVKASCGAGDVTVRLQ